MSALLNDTHRIITELGSDKPTTRNKAIEQLDQKLSNTKNELLALLGSKQNDLTWESVFEAAKDATIKHAKNMHEARDKAFQTLANKSYLYDIVLEKIINYNLDAGSQQHFLTKSCIFKAFEEGIKLRCVVKHFGYTFIKLLERGVYMSASYVGELRVSEFSRILSYLFELNVEDDVAMQHKVLKAITRTVQLASRRVQLHSDLIEYLPEVQLLIFSANTADKKNEVVRLYNLFVSELFVDYHRKLCQFIQDTLPKLCLFYTQNVFGSDVKNLFFQSVAISLHTFYPNIRAGDFSTFNAPVLDDWPKTMLRIRNITELELKTYTSMFPRNATRIALIPNDNFSKHFLSMSALAMYILLWDERMIRNTDDNCSRSKIRRTDDKLEHMIELVAKKENWFHEAWFSIFTEMLELSETIVNMVNFPLVLETVHHVLRIFGHEKNLLNVRICVCRLLQREKELGLDENHLGDLWTELANTLISELISKIEIMQDKHIMLQAMIKYGKLKPPECAKLMQNIMASSMLKRNECLATMRELLIHAEQCGIDKAQSSLETIINWAFSCSDKCNAALLLQNISSIDLKLSADTYAIGIISFLDEQQLLELRQNVSALNVATPQIASDLQTLRYKYNRKLICLTPAYQSQLHSSVAAHTAAAATVKNCLHQSHYELLMRLLNYETSTEQAVRNITKNLEALLKLSYIMERLLHYKVFGVENYLQCPIMKRIGLFFSHLELQLSHNDAVPMCENELSEILQNLGTILEVYTTNDVLLGFLEDQSLEKLLEFVINALKRTCATSSGEESSSLMSIQLKCVHILGHLCASSKHVEQAFNGIVCCKRKWRTNDILIIANLLCLSKNLSEVAIAWLIKEMLKVFQFHYMNLDIIEKVIDYIPTLFCIAIGHEMLLENMFIALNSLLKVAIIKSYSPRMTAKIIRCIPVLAQRSANIYALPNFISICKSVTKFLVFPSLHIQFATLETLSLLLNTSYVSRDPNRACDIHLEFCNALYGSIEWSKLMFDNDDIKLNSICVIVQTLTAVFIHSSYHQQAALLDLLYLCALHKINESDLYCFQTQVDHYNLSIRKLAAPFIDALIQRWMFKRYPISKFPYFIGYDAQDTFLRRKATIIAAYTFLYGSYEDIKRLDKYTDMSSLAQHTFPIVMAFMLPKQCKCEEAATDAFTQNYNTLKNNFKKLNIDYAAACKPSSSLVHCIISMICDQSIMRQLFSFTNCYREPDWYTLSGKSAYKCLYSMLCPAGEETNPTNWRASISVAYITQHPNMLYELFGQLKSNCYSSTFPMHTVQCLFLYCFIAELILDCAKLPDTHAENFFKYFVYDIWYFVPSFVVYTKSQLVQKAALNFLHSAIDKSPICVAKLHLNNITKQLLNCVLQSESPEVKVQAVSVLSNFVHKYLSHIDVHLLYDECQNNELLQPLLMYQQQNQLHEHDVVLFVSSFLEDCRVERLRSLRVCISAHKQQLQLHDTLLFRLISSLIRIVRDSHKTEHRLDAAKCLAEIGPLAMSHNSYYFQTDFETLECSTKDEPMLQFIDFMYETLERHLFHFNPSTQQALQTVARHVVNSTLGGTSLPEHPNLQIFAHELDAEDWFLNNYRNMRDIDWHAALRATEHLPYEQWMCAFMAKAFETCHWHGFDQLAANSVAFAEACLQPFVALLLHNNVKHISSLAFMLDYFFNKFCQQRNDAAAQQQYIFNEKRAIKKFLNVIECIRVVNDWQIPVNLSNVIVACNHCQAYFLSTMYLELWSCSAETNTFEDVTFQTSAKTAYESIGCMDAISGFLNPLHSRIDYHNLDNNWSDILLESNNVDLSYSQLCVSTLKRNGMQSLAHILQKENKVTDYELFWRLGCWEQQTEGSPQMNTPHNMELEFQQKHFLALKSIKNREEKNSLSAIENAYQCVVGIFQDISVECLQSVYKYLSWLSSLSQAEDFCEIQFATGKSGIDIFKKWQVELNLKYGNFNCKEYVLAHQIALFGMAGTRATRKIEEFYNEIPVNKYMLKCIEECKHAGELNLAKQYIVSLRERPQIKKETQIQALLEDADVHGKTGNHQIAKAILQHVVTHKDYQYCLQRAPALRMQGEFLMEMSAQSFSSILNEKFNVSLKMLSRFETEKSVLREQRADLFDWEKFDGFIQDNRKSAYAVIASYSDREYQNLDNHLKSDEMQVLRGIIKRNRETADTVSQREDRDKRIGAINMKRFANLDELQLQAIEQSRTEHLCTAISNYISYCLHDETPSTATMYRIFALWFANENNEPLNAHIQRQLLPLPSYKFIACLNQLTSRLNSKNPQFLKILAELLVRCVNDHPHHTLYHLFPLIYSHLDGTRNERFKIAQTIIEKVSDKRHVVVVSQLHVLFKALIEYANADSEKASTMPLSDKLKRIKNLDAIQCPTIELPVSSSNRYQIISIVRWNSKCSLVGGINAPKKLLCLCSDGKTRAQLLKGKDDLRQDAVMQQVFGLINGFLKTEQQSAVRNLQLRTYKVTPLSMRSGILEWCEDAIPLAKYLVGDGKTGAHKRYRPTDWTNAKCRQLSMTHLRSSKEKRFQIYNEICQNIKPVLQYFLMENFIAPGMWFEKRLAYTNSVATNSIVGYMLGLGDRHTQNILIDEKTAEVVHIDFGIAFDQGKVQATPETVPFRLTRDMVAPMGFCGTSGVFTKSSEATMHILRRYKSVITTVLEVLLHDPLYLWNVLPSSNDEPKNLLAQRALLAIQNKLEGREAGLPGNSSVEMHVQRLINEATLPSNLCMLFPGWDPYL